MASVFTLNNLQVLLDRVTALEEMVEGQQHEILHLHGDAVAMGRYTFHLHRKQKEDHVTIKVLHHWLQELTQGVESSCCRCGEGEVMEECQEVTEQEEGPPLVSLTPISLLSFHY